MQRLIIVYNPRSSRYADVRTEVLKPAAKLSGYMVGKYEVAKTNLEDNIKHLAKLLNNDDIVISAGGDATGVITVNAAMRALKKHKIRVKVAVLPYGNFNDLSRTLGLSTLSDVLTAKTAKFYPLAVYADQKFWRWATCYVTIGMTAVAVKLYDAPSMRKKLKSSFGRSVLSYTELIKWYFKNRHKQQFIPSFMLNKRAADPRISDYAAVNGRYMARVMKGREDYLKPKTFRSMTDRLTSFWRLFRLMTIAIVDRTPGVDTTSDTLEFFQPATVEVQAEGESKIFENIRQIEITKTDQYFLALTSHH